MLELACWSVLLLELLASSPAAAAGAHPASNTPLTPQLVEQVFTEVEAVRGLKRKEPVKVEFLEEAAFLEARRALARHDRNAERLRLFRAGTIAFGLAAPDVDLEGIIEHTLDEQIAGFYDPQSKRLCVRKSAKGEEVPGLRGIIAHELEHALQHQHFPAVMEAAVDSKAGADPSAALHALIEGDAEVTRLAVEARKLKQPLGEVLRAATTALRSMSIEKILRLSGRSPALLAAPALIREELIFPYFSGLGLAADLYRRGGFALLDQAFAHPPVSTHQVLHTESYFSGELPVEVAPPQAPANAHVLEQGRLGELGSRVVLETCVEPHVVRTYSDGWRGDAYTLFESPDHALGLAWRSAWEGGGAAAVASMLKSQDQCWRQTSLGKSAEGWTLSPAYRVRSVANRVAFLRGLPVGALDAALPGVLDFTVSQPKPAPALGAIEAPAADQRVSIKGDRFTSVRMGLDGEIPSGYSAREEPPVEIAIRSDDRRALLALMLVPLRYTPANVESFVDKQLRGLIGGSRLRFLGEKPYTLLGNRGTQSTWGVRQERLRIAAVPICGGAAIQAVIEVSLEEHAGQALERVIASLHQTGAAAACADLK